MSGTILVNTVPVPFETGETAAQAIERARANGAFAGSAVPPRYFCGIGQCQNCLVHVAGRGSAEACLTPCADGMELHVSAPVPGTANGGDHG